MQVVPHSLWAFDGSTFACSALDGLACPRPDDHLHFSRPDPLVEASCTSGSNKCLTNEDSRPLFTAKCFLLIRKFTNYFVVSASPYVAPPSALSAVQRRLPTPYVEFLARLLLAS